MLALQELGTIKPVVALADGVVMGAGAGLFMAATTRVLGPKALFAMCATHSTHRASGTFFRTHNRTHRVTARFAAPRPECALGIVPDCGATDWLGRVRPAEVRVACVAVSLNL